VIRIKLHKIAIILFVIIGSFLLLAYNPYLLFRYKYNFGNVNYYSDKNLPIDSCFPVGMSLKEVHNLVLNQVESSVFYKKDVQYDVFLCENSFIYKAYSFFLSESNAYCLWRFGGNVFVRNHNICSNGFRFSTNLSHLSTVIAHELVHSAVVKEIGQQKYLTTPKWVKEGYSEYVAHDEITLGFLKRRFDLEQATNFVKDERNDLFFSYDKYTLMVSYLILEKNKSEQSLFDSPPSEKELIKELLKWRVHENTRVITQNKKKIKQN
jgi:hypothetical protein